MKGDDAIEAPASEVSQSFRTSQPGASSMWQRRSWVYQNIGPDYTEKIVRPSIRTALRDAASHFAAAELYSAGSRTAYIAAVDSLLDEAFADKGIKRERVFLRRVKLPDVIMTAIEQKLAEKQNTHKDV